MIPRPRPRRPRGIPRALPLYLCMTLLAPLMGCRTAAPRGDYEAYRAIAVSPSLTTRLQAARAYLIQYPQGHFAGAAKALLNQHEAAFYSQSHGDTEQIHKYLSIYPEGQFAVEAGERLRMEAVLERAAATDRAARASRSEAEQAAQADAHRTWPSKAAEYWLRTLLTVKNWGSPIDEIAAQSGAFNFAFEAPPRPQCSRRECLKRYRSAYIVPNPGGMRVDGELELILRLRLSDGHLLRAEVLMPRRGFSRWYEHETRTLAHDENPEARQEAIGWALDRLLPWVNELAGEAVPVDAIPEPVDPPTLGGQGRSSAAAEAEPSISLPMALQGFQIGDAQLVFFAAAEDDDGEAYDGFFIQPAAPGDAPELGDP